MIYFFTFITALLLSTGQTFWKKAALNYPDLATKTTPAHAAFQVIFSVNFIFGAFLYVTATLIYLWLFSKFPFYVVQITLVSFSLILAAMISKFIFKESLSPLNYLGIIIILVGVFFVTLRR